MTIETADLTSRTEASLETFASQLETGLAEVLAKRQEALDAAGEAQALMSKQTEFLAHSLQAGQELLVSIPEGVRLFTKDPKRNQAVTEHRTVHIRLTTSGLEFLDSAENRITITDQVFTLSIVDADNPSPAETTE